MTQLAKKPAAERARWVHEALAERVGRDALVHVFLFDRERTCGQRPAVEGPIRAAVYIDDLPQMERLFIVLT